MHKLFTEGTKVFVLDGKQSVQVGYFLRYESFGKANTSVPMVNIEGKNYYCGGIVKEYDLDLHTILINLTPKQQWSYMVNLKYIEEVPTKHKR